MARTHFRWLTVLILGLLPALAPATIVQSNLTSSASEAAFPCSNADLIDGLQALVTNTTVSVSPQYGLISALTNGGLGAASTLGTNSVGNEAAWTITYYLNTAANTNGYTITNLSTFAGWTGGRVSQQYELQFAFQGDSAPGTFYTYGTFSVTHPTGTGSSKIELTDTTGEVAPNVGAVRFAFAGNGTIYRELDVHGFASTNTAQGRPTVTVYVATNGTHTSPFDTWGKAATNLPSALGVTANALILVSNGTYGISSAIAINDGTVLRSMNGPSNTVIRRTSGSTRIFDLTASATIDGFTIRDGSTSSGAGAINMTAGTIRNCLFTSNSGVYGAIHMTGGNVSNCTFWANSASADGGGIHMASPGGVVANCIFTNNSVGRWGGGFEFENATAGSVIRNCFIARNTAAQAGGGLSAYLWNASDRAVIQNCTIVSNSSPVTGGGVWQSQSGSLSMTNSIVWDNGAPADPNIGGTVGAGYSCSPVWTPANQGNGNITASPLFKDSAAGNYRLALGSPCIDAATNLAAVAFDLDANPRPYDGDFNSVAAPDMGAYEMSEASPFFCNFTAATTTGTNSLDAVFTASISGSNTNIAWYGWDFNNDGTNDVSGGGYGVVTGYYAEPGVYSVKLTVENTSSEITNFTRTAYIRVYSGDGVAYVRTNGLNQWPYHTWAKAATTIQAAMDVAPNMLVLVSNGTYNLTAELVPNSGTVLRSLTGPTNTIIRRSGGTTRLFNINTYAGSPVSGVVIDGFTLREANSSAIYMTTGTVQNCLFTANSGGTYGAIDMAGGVVSSCVFTANAANYDGGAIHMKSPGGQVVSCIMTDNTAGRWGGGMEFENTLAGALIRNCLVARNRSVNQGGGISSFGAVSRIESCTVVSNSCGNGDGAYPPLGGGGVWKSGAGTASMTNTIVYFNAAPVGTNLSGTVTAGYCFSPDLTDGVSSNRTADPGLENLVGGDYRLTLASPCANAGMNMGWMSGAVDLDGSPRLLRGVVDVGAYEAALPRGILIHIH